MLGVFEEVFITVCLCLLQVVPGTGFALPYFSFFFAFILSGYTSVCLDKVGFSKHKKTGSLKSGNHQATSA